MATVPLLNVLESQLNSQKLEKQVEAEKMLPLDHKRRQLAKYMPTEPDTRHVIKRHKNF